jgi:hypothetical protein
MVWRYSVRADLARGRSDHVAEVMWDISKAFDHVKRKVLVKRALALGYPASILRLSMRSYGWSRKLVDGQLISEESMPRMGYRDRVGFCHI